MVASVDAAYADVEQASLYDAECPWHPQDDFYLALDLAAGSVLDVGCGTGGRLVRAREVGHRGRLVGVDPGVGMLAVARAKSDRVEWVYGDAQSFDLGSRFALITMTGHAFQVLLDDASVEAALANFHRHLAPDGLLAFETRNPAARAWESWVTAQSRSEIEGPDGTPYEVWVDHPVETGPELVTFLAVTRSLTTGQEWTGASTLRFIGPDQLRDMLAAAGLVIEGWYGDWDRSPVTATSPEIVVLARRDGRDRLGERARMVRHGERGAAVHRGPAVPS